MFFLPETCQEFGVAFPTAPKERAVLPQRDLRANEASKRALMPMRFPAALLALGLLALGAAFPALNARPTLAWAAPQIQGQKQTQTRIVWNKTSLRSLARGGNYARMIRLRNGDLVCGYGDGSGVWAKRSRDNGATWDAGILVGPKQAGANFANAELLQLQNGDILFFCNLRPFKEPLDPPLHFAIGVARSKNGGASWSPVELVYRAGTRFNDGCWEPAAMQLPSGEVQLFFADEGPYTRSDEQQISLLRSFDGGQTWTAPRAASFRAGHRDGMPVPVQLRNGSLAFSIEDNGARGTFKPVIIGATRGDNWKSGTIPADSPNRWSALATPLDARVYAGAPYLRVLESGETALSFQQSEDGGLEHCQMVVCLGDQTAHGFAGNSRPFEGFQTGSQLWGSLLVKDRRTLVALTSTKIDGIYGVWTIEGTIIGG